MLGGSNTSEEPDREDSSQRHHDSIDATTRGRHCASLGATCQLQTRLRARAPRVEFSTHGVIQVHVPWAAPPGGRAGMHAAKPRAGALGSCWAPYAQRDYVALATRTARGRHQA